MKTRTVSSDQIAIASFILTVAPYHLLGQRFRAFWNGATCARSANKMQHFRLKLAGVNDLSAWSRWSNITMTLLRCWWIVHITVLRGIPQRCMCRTRPWSSVLVSSSRNTIEIEGQLTCKRISFRPSPCLRHSDSFSVTGDDTQEVVRCHTVTG